MSARIFHPGKLLLYIGLSAADLVLTYQLLQQSDGRIYESNPIANAWLCAYGWGGLVLFKMIAMLLTGSLAAFVSVHSPQRGGHILKFACCALALVVLYSFSLTRSLDRGPNQQAERQARLNSQIALHQEYDTAVHQLQVDLIAGRCSLPEAVEKLEQCDKAHSALYLGYLHERHPGCSNRDCLALELVESVLSFLRDQPAKKDRVARQFIETSGSPSAPLASAIASINLASTETK